MSAPIPLHVAPNKTGVEQLFVALDAAMSTRPLKPRSAGVSSLTLFQGLRPTCLGAPPPGPHRCSRNLKHPGNHRLSKARAKHRDGTKPKFFLGRLCQLPSVAMRRHEQTYMRSNALRQLFGCRISKG